MEDKTRFAFLLAVLSMINRTFRCLLAYVNTRLVNVKNLFWRSSGNADSQMNMLSQAEKDFFLEYGKMVRNYQNSLPIELDLLTDMEPPTDLFIEIRVLDDCGEILTSNGDVLKLERNATLLVRRCDVEFLLRQNKVIQTN